MSLPTSPSPMPVVAHNDDTILPSSHSPDIFSPVVGHTGVVTSHRLRHYYLGITTELDLLCCIACPTTVLLGASTAHVHVKTHAPPQQRAKFTANRVNKAFSRYKVYRGLVSLQSGAYCLNIIANPTPSSLCNSLCLKLTELPTPTSYIKPFSFLKMFEAFECLVCYETGTCYLARVEDTMKNHFGKKHRDVSRERQSLQRQVKVQSFSHPEDKNHRDFIVLPDLADLAEVDETERYQASPRDMYEAFVDSFKPAAEQNPEEGLSLKDTQPFLWFTGWASHIRGHDPKFLCDLVKSPEPGSDLDRLVVAAKILFTDAQVTIDKTHEFYRTALMDDGTG
jgi:hypothetical protein